MSTTKTSSQHVNEVRENLEPLVAALGLIHKSHPWHGIDLHPDFPEKVTAFIEVVPSDTVKYEIDKITGHLMIDRPQRFSSTIPCLYGLVPKTLCAESVAELSIAATNRPSLLGDDDPIDICVLTENTISRGDIQACAIPIGGLRMIDNGEVDDKIIAVLEGDSTYGKWTSISDVPTEMIDRLRHYFLTYKQSPDSLETACEITHVYDVDEAHSCLKKSSEDYLRSFANIDGIIAAAAGSS